MVILLTKFLAHRTRRREFQSEGREDIAWWIGHWICVIAAWLGLLLSLAVLAVPVFKDHDGGARGSLAQQPRSPQRSLPWMSRSHTGRSDNSGPRPIKSWQSKMMLIRSVVHRQRADRCAQADELGGAGHRCGLDSTSTGPDVNDGKCEAGQCHQGGKAQDHSAGGAAGCTRQEMMGSRPKYRR